MEGSSGFIFIITSYSIVLAVFATHKVNQVMTSWTCWAWWTHTYQFYFCHTHPLYNSLCICHNAGWCHSVLLFNTGILHLLIKTASLTCLVRQSLELPVTLAVYSPATPWCFLLWCFIMNDLLLLFLYLLVCSFPLVNRFLDVSPIYWLLWSAGQRWQSTW